MQSKTSFFNKTIFRKNLTKCWPLWAVASFGLSMFPMALLMIVPRDDSVVTMEAAYQLLYGVLRPNLIGACVYSLIVAAVVWKYLFSTRSIGMMHTLPVRRENLFLTGLLSGFAILLIPYVIAGLLSVAIMGYFGLFPIKAILLCALCVIGEYVVFFGLATFVAFITGTSQGLICIYLVVNFLAQLIEWLGTSYAKGFLFGFSESYTGALKFLSPLMNMLANVGADSLVIDRSEVVLLMGGNLILIYAGVSLILILLALLLYRKRPSELSGNVVTAKWLRPIFTTIFTAVVGLAGGRILYTLFFLNDLTNQTRTVPMILCLIVAGLIAYFIANMILQKSARVFTKKRIPGMVITAAVAILFCAFLKLDFLGIEGRIPALADISSVEISTSNYAYTFETAEYPEEVAMAVDLQRAILESKDRFIRTNEEDYEKYSAFVSYTYTLNDGTKLSREYYLFNLDMNPSDPLSLEAKYWAMDDEIVRLFMLTYGKEYYVEPFDDEYEVIPDLYEYEEDYGSY